MRKRNNIEHKFREVFNKDIPNVGWNEPADDLWDNIEKGIPNAQNENNKKGLLLWLLFLLLGVCVVSYLYTELNNYKSIVADTDVEIAQLSEKLENSTSKIKSLENEISVAEQLKSINTRSIKNEPKSQPVETVLKTKTIEPRVTARDISENIYAKPIENIMIGSNFEESGVYIIIQSEVPSTKNLEDQKILESRVVGNIESLSVTTTPLKLNKRNLHFSRVDISLENESSYIDKGLYLVATTGANKSLLNVSGNHTTSAAELIDSEYGKLGQSISLSLSKAISSSIYLNAGLAYDRQVLHTDYDLTLGYDIRDEEIKNNLGSIHFSHSLPSFSGNLDTELILSRSLDDQVSDDESVNLDFNTRSTFYEVGLPIGISYFSGQGRSGLSLGFRLTPTYISSATSAIHQVVSHHDFINQSDASSLSTSQHNAFQLLAGMNIGYSVTISESISIGAQLSYDKSLTQLIKTETYQSSVDRVSAAISFTNRL